MKLCRHGEEEVLRLNQAVNPDGTVFPYLTFPNLEKTGMVRHLFTTRDGGVSEGMFRSLNLSFLRGDDEAAVHENYRRIARVMESDEAHFVLTDQTHTTNVRCVTEEDAGKGLVRERDYQDVDGLVTNVPGLVLGAFFADCVPLFFVDPVHRAIGLSHSGWRGTVNRMGKATVEKMTSLYGTDPGELICAIGPSICHDCYEVGDDVALQFRAAFPGHETEVLSPEVRDGREVPGKSLLDLWRANRIVLEEAGVLPEHVALTDICTCENGDVLFSHRASSGKRGNLGAFMKLIG